MSELITGQNLLNTPVGAASGNTGNTVQTTAATDAQRFADAMAASQVALEEDSSSSLGQDNDDTEDRFLTLLVAQMRNQDPMNPLENAEVTTQLAQINTVRGIEQLGTTVKQLLAQSGRNDPIASSSALGRQILVEQDVFRVNDSESSMTLGANLSAPVPNLVARVTDASGQQVKAISLGPQQAGVVTFEWDGTDDSQLPVSEGDYQVFFETAGQTEPGVIQPLVSHRVVGITRGQDALDYRVQSGASVSANDVIGIF